MITERIFGIIVNPEGIVRVVIVFIINAALPVAGAFNAEVIIGYPGKFAITATRFK